MGSLKAGPPIWKHVTSGGTSRESSNGGLHDAGLTCLMVTIRLHKQMRPIYQCNWPSTPIATGFMKKKKKKKKRKIGCSAAGAFMAKKSCHVFYGWYKLINPLIYWRVYCWVFRIVQLTYHSFGVPNPDFPGVARALPPQHLPLPLWRWLQRRSGAQSYR